MKTARQSLSALLAGLALAAACVPLLAQQTQQILGQPPLCEASAAVILPCPEPPGDCLVVGDNEVKDRLFHFPIHNGAVMTDKQGDLEIPDAAKNEVADIEALVALGGDQLLVWGSHSRNSDCEAKDKRRRFTVLGLAAGKPNTGRRVKSPAIDCGVLPTPQTAPDPVAAAVCATITVAERHAQQSAGTGTKAECEKANPFNAEGALAVPGSTEPRIWIGLRAPLLAVHPTDPAHGQLAILLRLKDLDAFTADRIALLDLDGRGVRDLAYADGEVWVIAGPSDDREEPFQLRHFPAAALDGSAVISTGWARNLPSSAEGLAIQGQQAFVVIDGSEPLNGNTACQKPAGLVVFDLP